MKTTKLNLKNEVAAVLGRELVGIEPACVAHYASGGMMNPVDIARTIIERHINNLNRDISIKQEQLLGLEKELRVVNDWCKGA